MDMKNDYSPPSHLVFYYSSALFVVLGCEDNEFALRDSVSHAVTEDLVTYPKRRKLTTMIELKTAWKNTHYTNVEPPDCRIIYTYYAI